MTSLTKKIISKFDYRSYYLDGCIDIIVVKQNNGSLKSTPFHVRFGKYAGYEYTVDLIVNGNITNVQMKLGKDGSAYFERSQLSSGYLSDDTYSEKNLTFGEVLDVGKNKYLKPDDLFNSEKKNSTWLSSFIFWQKGNNSKKEEDIKAEGLNNLKEIQKQDASSQALSQIQQQQQQNLQQELQLQKSQTSSVIPPIEIEKEQQQSEQDSLSPREQIIEISLCGKSVFQSNLTQIQKLQIFEQYKLSFSTFEKDQIKIINNKDLVFKFGDKFLNKETGLIQLIAKFVFKTELQGDQQDSTQKKNVPQQQQQQQQKQQGEQWYRRILGKKKGSEQIEQVEHVNKRLEETESTVKQNQQQFKSQDRMRKMSEDTCETLSTGSYTKRRKPQKPVLIPNSNILHSLGLKKGANKITYRLCIPKKNEVVELTGTIFLYDQSTKLVISDIDGTITKSDILGQLMPKLGTDWNHDGVAALYQKISSLGYQMIYLTARAIGQSDQTKEFIYNLEQQKIKLPLGPVILSPDSLFPAFKREVIDGTPELFKITALKEIRNLFSGETPFYCGFGNRINDSAAYQAINVDVRRIFIINPESKIHQHNTNEITSYIEMNKNIHVYFPPVGEKEYNESNFWRLPINDSIDFDYQ